MPFGSLTTGSDFTTKNLPTLSGGLVLVPVYNPTNLTLTTVQATQAPTVTGLSPTSGPLAGGTPVTITGTGFTGATAVDFGTTAATSYTVVSSTDITATSPAGTGTVDVTVTTPVGTSPTSAADQFTYTAAPAVTGLSPTAVRRPAALR